MKKYYTDWKTITVTIGVGLAIFIFGIYSTNLEKGYSQIIFFRTAVLTLIPVAFVILLATKYSYAEISGTTLRFIYLLFYRRIIAINSITEINDQGTYRMAKKTFRSIFIFYKDDNGNTKYIELIITIFSEKTLGNLIKKLKQINPQIELNKYSEKLMKISQ